MYTVMKGHILACACEVLKVSGMDDAQLCQQDSRMPPNKNSSDIAQDVVNRCTLVDAAFAGSFFVIDDRDGAYSYAHVFC